MGGLWNLRYDLLFSTSIGPPIMLSSSRFLHVIVEKNSKVVCGESLVLEISFD